MARWISLACALLGLVLLGVRLSGPREPERTAVLTPAAGEEPEPRPPAVLRAPDEDGRAPGPEREPAEGIDIEHESAVPGELRGGPLDDTAAVAVLVVRAVDASRAPLARVRVTAWPRGLGAILRPVSGPRAQRGESPLTSADGRVELELAPGEAVRVEADGEDDDVGHAEAEVEPLAPGERRELVLELATGRDRPFCLRVLARDDGTAIAGALVEIRGAPRLRAAETHGGWKFSDGELGDGVTDAEGRFEARLRSWDHPELRVRAAGFGEVRVPAEEGHERPETARVVVLLRAAELRASVVDGRGAPLTGATVRLWTESYELWDRAPIEPRVAVRDGPEWTQEVPRSGVCVFAGLPPEVPLRVEIWASRSIEKDLVPLTLRPGEVRDVEWAVGRGCRVTGTLVDQDDRPIPSRRLWLLRATRDGPRVFQEYERREVVAEATTDASGRFAFDDVASGRWWLGPAAVRSEWEDRVEDALAPIGIVVEVPEGSPAQEVVLRAHRGLYVEGRVLDPAGEPASDVYVFGESGAVGLGFQARTREDGSFALGPLEPGPYELTAHRRDDARSDPVEANAGDAGVVLVLNAGGALKGTVRDGATGESTPARLLLGRCDDPKRGWWGNYASGGAFRFDGLEPGTYCLAARASGGRVALVHDVAVAAGETREIEVTLAPGATLRVAHAGTSGELRYEVFAERIRVAAETVAAGAVSETTVPVGRLLLEWSGSRGAAEAEPRSDTRELVAGVGETLELVLGDER